MIPRCATLFASSLSTRIKQPWSGSVEDEMSRWMRPAKTSGEFLSELLSQGVRRRVCYLIDMLLHFFPGLGLGVVFAIPQLLDLLDVMAAMRQKKALHCVFRQIRICFAQEGRDLFGV